MYRDLLETIREGRWDLSDLLGEPSEEVIAAKLRQLEQSLACFEERREVLERGPGAVDFLAALADCEDLRAQLTVLLYHGELWLQS